MYARKTHCINTLEYISQIESKLHLNKSKNYIWKSIPTFSPTFWDENVLSVGVSSECFLQNNSKNT